MCGISGIIKFDKTSVSLSDIDKLTDNLAHRGPDGRGVWYNQDENIALGHRRLSILDISEAGHQPMVAVQENLVIAFNGEVYNFVELRDELQREGYVFDSQTDTEVVVKAYHRWGTDMLNKFNGMWAMAIYDINLNRLILSRDRFGVKPLYYYQDTDELVFASEVQAIHKHLGTKATINKEVIDVILNFGRNYDQPYHGTENTYLEDVKSLKAGTNLIIENNHLELYTWYTLPRVYVPKTFKDQAVELKRLLTDACKLRLRSDVPIGTCLSGGIDSGAISSLISTFNANEDARFSNFSHRSFCAGFPGVEFDETSDAVRLSKQLDIELDIERVNAPSVTMLEKSMDQMDGPMPTFSFFPIWQLYGHIKSQKITVTLDGQGADEMLGGYYMGYEAMQGALDLFNPFWFYDVKDTYSNLHTGSRSWVKDHFDYIKKAKFIQFKQALKLPIKKLLSVFKLYTLEETNSTIPKEGNPILKQFNNTLDKALYQQFHHTLLPFLLHQYDRASMANGVECRMPFMDYRVVEYIFSLPPQSKVGGGYTKRVLREALKGVLPDETRLNKTKTGFNAPTTEWFKTDLNAWFVSQITSQSFLENPYFDGKKISKEFLEMLHSEKANDYGWKFWSHVHFNYWLSNITYNA